MVIAGDFNAGPKGGRFWDELQLFCRDNLFNIADLILGSDTFTFLSISHHNSTSWLDHIIESRRGITSDIEFNYNSVLYDHFPIEFSLCFNYTVNRSQYIQPNTPRELVNWSKLSENDKVKYGFNTALNFNNHLWMPIFNCSHIETISRLNSVYVLIILLTVIGILSRTPLESL